jgi:hypothetical protein
MYKARRMVVLVAGHLLQGNFKDWGTVTGQGPAAHPAAVVAVVNANHLIKVLVAGEGDAITLVKRHGLVLRQNERTG